MSEALDDWRDLRASQGWQRLRTYAAAEWTGEAFTRIVAQVANNVNDAEALSKLRQVLAARAAVDRLFAVPDEQIAKLERPAAEASSRRGAL
jgi:hypothetical protein